MNQMPAPSGNLGREPAYYEYLAGIELNKDAIRSLEKQVAELNEDLNSKLDNVRILTEQLEAPKKEIIDQAEETSKREEGFKALQPFSGYYLNIWMKKQIPGGTSTLQLYISKPVNGVIRTAYILGASMLGAVGVIVHAYQFAKCGIDSDPRINKKAWEHLTATGIDGKAFAEGIITTALAISLLASSYFIFLPSAPVLALAGAVSSLVIFTFSSPVLGCMLALDTMEGKYLTETYLKIKHEKEMAKSRLDEVKMIFDQIELSYKTEEAKRKKYEEKARFARTSKKFTSIKDKLSSSRETVNRQGQAYAKLNHSYDDLFDKHEKVTTALEILYANIARSSNDLSRVKATLKDGLTAMIEIKDCLKLDEEDVKAVEKLIQ